MRNSIDTVRRVDRHQTALRTLLFGANVPQSLAVQYAGDRNSHTVRHTRSLGHLNPSSVIEGMARDGAKTKC